MTGTIGLQHTSLQFSDSADAWKKMGKNLFAYAKANGNVLLSGTEAGDSSNAKILKDAADTAGFWCYVHDSGEWVAFDKSWGSHQDHGWKGPLVPGQSGSASSGGHSPRGIAWVTVNPKDPNLPWVSLGSVHFLTQNSIDAGPPGTSNKPLQDGALEWCQAKGSDGKIAFINGDVNMNDKAKNVWSTDQIVTCWDELGKWPDTHEGGPTSTIDVISRYKPDGAKFTSAQAVPDSEANLSSDHKLIQAKVKV